MPNTNKNGTAGQPTKMTPVVLATIRNAADFGCNDREILAQLTITGNRIAQSTLSDYFSKHPDFRQEIDDRQQSPILRAKQTLNQAIEDVKNGDLTLKYLERKCKNEFSTKTEVDTSVNITNDALDKLGKIINGKSD